jgi:hypothetical protein
MDNFYLPSTAVITPFVSASKSNNPVFNSKNGIILAHLNATTGKIFTTPLANNNIARLGHLTGKKFNPESL